MTKQTNWIEKWRGESGTNGRVSSRYGVSPGNVKKLLARDAAALELAEAVESYFEVDGSLLDNTLRVNAAMRKLRAVVEGEK